MTLQSTLRTGLKQLPDEVLAKILALLADADQASISKLRSKRWRTLLAQTGMDLLRKLDRPLTAGVRSLARIAEVHRAQLSIPSLSHLSCTDCVLKNGDCHFYHTACLQPARRKMTVKLRSSLTTSLAQTSNKVELMQLLCRCAVLLAITAWKRVT